MFAKVYSQIFDSSIAENYTVRHVFMDLLVLADSEGVVDMTMHAIARRTNVPQEVIRDAIQVLSEPDPASRSEAEDGRRLALVDTHRDWGWRIINYEHYRKLRDEEGRRAYHRDYMRSYRESGKGPDVKNVNSCEVPLTSVKESDAGLTHAEGDAEASSPKRRSSSKKVSDETLPALKDRFSKLGVNVELETEKARRWIQDHPPRQFTKNFLTRWLNRASSDCVPPKPVVPMVAGNNDLTFEKWRAQE
jgi:hypothetical protein